MTLFCGWFSVTLASNENRPSNSRIVLSVRVLELKTLGGGGGGGGGGGAQVVLHPPPPPTRIWIRPKREWWAHGSKPIVQVEGAWIGH